MKRTALTLFLLSSTTLASPKNPPALLTGAVHCLAVKNFLPSSRAASRTFGYFLDEESYSPEKVIYVVNYAGPDKSNGLVFAIFLTEHDGHQHFNIQNNAAFVLSRREFDRISFVGADQPLGGIWTQERIAMAIKQIETGTRFTLDKKDLSAAESSTTCESYTENSR